MPGEPKVPKPSAGHRVDPRRHRVNNPALLGTGGGICVGTDPGAGPLQRVWPSSPGSSRVSWRSAAGT